MQIVDSEVRRVSDPSTPSPQPVEPEDETRVGYLEIKGIDQRLRHPIRHRAVPKVE